MISTVIEDTVATVTIDRLDVHNALDVASLVELESAVRSADDDPAVSVIVITGAGVRAFVAGGDLAELDEPRGVGQALDLPMQRVFDGISRSSTPTIAAINGVALGGGLELALACDIRIASTAASFALPELAWSLLPAAGGVSRLTRLIGPGRALELILTGRRIPADEAMSIGLVTALTAPEELLGVAHETARTIGAKAPLAVRFARLVTRVAVDAPLDTSLIAESLGLAALHGTQDKTEGTRSFLEKRPARFEGR